MKVALHTCCGPCLLEPLDALSAESERLVVVYANPNIHPVEEYERRLEVVASYARSTGVEVAVLEPDREEWMRRVGRFGTDRRQRCRACYRLRLEIVCRWAAEQGLDTVATTLTVSPYQDAEAIGEEGRAAASGLGVAYADRDFRDRYPAATRRSRELGMYRQNYCGCAFSEEEARADREERKKKRAAGNG